MEEKTFALKAELLKAMAQPTRLKILECLREGERCICEIIPAVNGEQSNISRHISFMQKGHLVTTRKDGVKVMVKVTDRKIFDILDQVCAILRKQMTEHGKLLKAL
ncbi:MAG TPA: metalloregulator ArsR/SmtB family transcription factor [Thermodesulfobacteriota bacterium]|nr:metalloregulator ArsR/SmtB family transcription factor [Thermodesulfobacteriota bacterium]